MALNIKHPDADRLARELAARTGESLTDAVPVKGSGAKKTAQGAVASS